MQTNTESSWETWPYESPTDQELPEVQIRFDAPEDGTFTASVVEPPGGLERLELKGRWDTGDVLFTRVAMEATDITVDTVRIPIGKIRRRIANLILQDPEHADVRAMIYDFADPRQVSGKFPDRRQVDAAQKAGLAASLALKGTGSRTGRPPLAGDFLHWITRLHQETYLEAPHRFIAALTERLHALAKSDPEGRLEELSESSSSKITANLSAETVKYWLRRARAEGWIDSNHWGRPGPTLLDRESGP